MIIEEQTLLQTRPHTISVQLTKWQDRLREKSTEDKKMTTNMTLLTQEDDKIAA